MGKTFEAVVIVKGKRPANATPAQAQRLRAQGMSVAEIARAWGISASRVYAILKRA